MDEHARHREILLEHSEHPHGYGRLEAPSIATHARDERTGDALWLDVLLAGQSIAALGWEAGGSAVFRASCSLMCEAVTGRTRAEALACSENFISLLTTPAGDDAAAWAALGDLAALSGIRHLPMRVICAALPWRTLGGMLGGE